jgi:tetratricopeptide (TPR) repeat protein
MRIALYAFLALAAVAPASAQRYILKDGRVLNQADVTLRDGSLVRGLSSGGEAGSVEVSYPLSQVVRLDWPEPAELAAGRTLLASGKPADAVEKALGVYRQFAPFTKIPGSWWGEAAIIRARGLLDQAKTDEAERAAREIIAAAPDAESTGAAQLIIAELQIRSERGDLADAMLDTLLTARSSGDVEARALVLRGDIAFKRKNFERALEYYLQVPAFYGIQDSILPAAILGSARAYKGFGDTARAERAYLEVIVSYPNTAEAAKAKTESQL